MSSLVEEIADRNHTGSFSGEIQSEGGSRTAEDSDDRVQFLAAVLEIGTSHGKVGTTECGYGNEENAILPVEKSVSLESRLRNDGGRNGHRLSRGGGSIRCWSLRKRGGAERKD